MLNWLLGHGQKEHLSLQQLTEVSEGTYFSRFYIGKHIDSSLKTDFKVRMLDHYDIYVLLNYVYVKLKHFNIIISEAHRHSKSQSEYFEN